MRVLRKKWLGKRMDIAQVLPKYAELAFGSS
jgi:hypothetical protein